MTQDLPIENIARVYTMIATDYKVAVRKDDRRRQRKLMALVTALEGAYSDDMEALRK